MEPIYVQEFDITDNTVDCFGRLKPSMILYFVQEVAGKHFNRISMDYDALEKLGMFWAIIRQRVQITRLPLRGEKIRVETWPMPTTRVAYPRSVVAYDEQGNEVFRSISIWVLMDVNTRNMILPGKSGIAVAGTLRGTDLDRNCHMNNTKYMDWIDDLLPSAFHQGHEVKEFTVCYLSETREGQVLDLHWDFLEEGILQVDAYRNAGEKDERVFSARLIFG